MKNTLSWGEREGGECGEGGREGGECGEGGREGGECGEGGRESERPKSTTSCMNQPACQLGKNETTIGPLHYVAPSASGANQWGFEDMSCTVLVTSL